MARKLFRDPDGRIRIGESAVKATHQADLPAADDPRWIAGVPTALDTTVLTLSPFSPTGRLDVCLGRKPSDPISQYPYHPPFDGVKAWMPLDRIVWSDVDYHVSLPGVWEDLGQGHYGRFYGNDRDRWLEATVYDGKVIIQAKKHGAISGVITAAVSIGQYNIPVSARKEEIEAAVASLEARLGQEKENPNQQHFCSACFSHQILITRKSRYQTHHPLTPRWGSLRFA
jgi:hypothetical protein